MNIAAPSTPPSPTRIRACDECKRRKRKCDAKSPRCSLCAGTGTECKYSVPKRRGPKPRVRDRLHTTNANDVQLGDFHDDLGATSSPATPLESPPHKTLGFGHSGEYWQAGCLLPSGGGTNGTIAAIEQGNQPLLIHQALSQSTRNIRSEMDAVARDCIDLFMQRCFPSFPIVSPSKLQKEVHLLLPSSSHLFAPAPYATTPGHDQQGSGMYEMRAFALITSLCAFMCHKGDAFALGHSSELVMPFLQASRRMLLCWEDQDINHPDSSSLAIRILHAAIFHALGKRQLSWYTMGQAQRIALEMRLYEEDSFKGLDHVESQLLRNIFWVLYIADKSAWILSDLPTTFHEIGLARPLTTTIQPREEPCLLNVEKEEHHWPYERQVQEGLQICCHVWSVGVELLLDMKIASRMKARSEPLATESNPFSLSMMRSYMEFNVVMDSLPAWLRDPNSHVGSSVTTTAFQRLAFWVQRADLVVTYHCLRLILLQRAFQQGFCSLLGVTDNEEMLALHNIEITQDLLTASKDIPFEALLANGEPLVEKFRQVGAKLLEIAAQSQSRSISSRAKTLFSALIDIIARLDSRVSDELIADVSP